MNNKLKTYQKSKGGENMSEKEVVIKVQGLRKYYRNIKAVDGIDFEIREGEIFGIVGPNGAGKTTTVECIEGLRVPDAGKISVLSLIHI